MKWIKSSFCESGSCVEVSFGDNWVGVRNSDMPSEAVWFTPEEWKIFLLGASQGDFDTPANGENR